MINGLIKKYEIKKKLDLCENLVGKTMGRGKNLRFEYEKNLPQQILISLTFSFYKSHTTGLRVKHKSKTKFRSQKTTVNVLETFVFSLCNFFKKSWHFSFLSDDTYI